MANIDSAIEQPTGEVRWVTDDPLSSLPPKLQQCWHVVSYKDGKAISSCTEWRDVPVVVTPSTEKSDEHSG